MIVERIKIQCSRCGEVLIRYARRSEDTESEYNRLMGGESFFVCSYCKSSIAFTPIFARFPNVDIGDSVVVWDEVLA